MVDYHRFCDTVLNPEEIKLVLESWKAIAIREAAQLKKQSTANHHHQENNMIKGNGGERGERGGGYGRGDTGGMLPRSSGHGPSSSLSSSSANGQKQISKHHNSGSYY